MTGDANGGGGGPSVKTARPDPADRPQSDGRLLIWRHPAWVRLTHWVNALVVILMLMSGINILMAHPHLYWGMASTFDASWLSVPRVPDWIMLPQHRDLAGARRWHLTLAWVFVINGLIYLSMLILTRRLRRQLWPTPNEVRHIPQAIADHARLQFPQDERARTYNVLQKLSYLGMILAILPLMVITGLAMSPMMNAAWPWLLPLLGGRQSARTLHFLATSGIVLFVAVHVGLVIWTGLFNNLRAMTTGWFAIRPETPAAPEASDEAP